jgi:Domain of unknown function (DUF4145)
MIKTHFCQRIFTERNIPPFPCPTCGASLIPAEKGLHVFQSSESKELCGGGDTEFGPFHLHFKCSQRSCEEPVICVGLFGLQQDEDDFGRKYTTKVLSPLFFYPTIQVFDFPRVLPSKIKEPLMKSFSHFWSDPGAAGNSLRIAVEALLDHQRVRKKTTTKRGESYALKLHDRIVAFQKTKPDLAEKLLAIKWLGNSGSHLSGLKHEDLLTGYEFFDHVLHEIFVKHTQKLHRLAKRINKRRGPV